MEDTRLKIGIEGLDDILNGGLPSGHLYLLEGEPGTGKTTIALQFLMEGAKTGESALYVTLSESKQELHSVAESHGWTLDGIEIFELLPEENSLGIERQYTVFHPAEVELADTTRAILDRVEHCQARRVVVDSLSELRMLAQEPIRYRRQLLALKQYFSGKRCTVVLLDDRTSTQDDLQLHSVVHGVISLENLPREYGIKRRRMQITKLRASAFREGYHDYSIKRGGVHIYPRLVAAEHNPGFSSELVTSQVPELDALFGGGIHRGTSTLVTGPAGSGKSTICAKYAVEAARRGEAVSVYLFDEGLRTYLSRLNSLGMDPEKHLQSGMLTVEQIDPAELSPGEFVARVRNSVSSRHSRVVVIDSLNGFMNSMPGERYLPIQLHELISYMNQQGVVTLLVFAQHGLLADQLMSVVDVSYLADAVLLLRYFEANAALKWAVSVVKNRSGNHEKSVRELIFNGGIKLGKPLTAFRGMISGTPETVGSHPGQTYPEDGN
ncbi:MAG TPA: ATPase domain-containing protein [Terriglobales bacterium]|nr:ATPase domain-containing protein [Terriglobales bacterium]